MEDQKPDKLLNRRVHMANERTFLAWIRTSIGMMAFGFVLEKFALFTRQMSVIMSLQTPHEIHLPSHGYSAILGIVMIALGTLLGGLAFVKYKKAEKQIDDDTWQPTSTLDALLTLVVLIVGILLVVYLMM